MTPRSIKNLKTIFLAAALCLFISGCGVRGRPQPPLTPPELGRGEPTFKRATEEFAFPQVPQPESTPEPESPYGDSN